MRQVLGAILMAIGILIGGASGLCALLLIGLESGGSGRSNEIFDILLVLGTPILIGAGLFAGGLALQRSDRDDRSDP